MSIGSTSDEDVGLNQYLFYQLNEKWKLGNRVEWWKDDGVSHYQYSTGVNYTPLERLRIRSEVRYDRGSTTVDQLSFGTDAILTF